MKRKCCGIAIILTALLLGGCGTGQKDVQEKKERVTTETQAQEQEKQEEFFLSPEESADVPMVMEEYSEDTPYQELAAFLANYYQIPEEYQSDTRYYYNYTDLDEDGTNEIFAVVIGEYTEVDFGDPALILREQEGTFEVLEAFEGVHTPVTISKQTTNGWHDIIYRQFGGEVEDGYRICRYNPDGGYQTEISEVTDRMDSVVGIQILSNNLIDDMDQGRYLTLAPKMEE